MTTSDEQKFPLLDADKRLQELITLIDRLERLSADSSWAHQAAGLRGCLLDALDQIENGLEPPIALADWVTQSFTILVKAARDVPGDDKRINLARTP